MRKAKEKLAYTPRDIERALTLLRHLERSIHKDYRENLITADEHNTAVMLFIRLKERVWHTPPSTYRMVETARPLEIEHARVATAHILPREPVPTWRLAGHVSDSPVLEVAS